jgi:hypothetical protein
VTVAYVLTPAELLILEAVARTSDELQRLEAAVRALPEAELVVRGSAGQPKTHPLLEEVRRHRELLDRLCNSLNLPDETQEFGVRGASKHAQKAAKARWSGRGEAS